jgi:hypothetical protein
MKTFSSEKEAVVELKDQCSRGLDSAMVDGPCDGEFTIMPVSDTVEFGFYTTATLDGRLCTVQDNAPAAPVVCFP